MATDATEPQLTDRIQRLERAIASGVLRVTFDGGRAILYRSLDEMEAVLRRLRAERAALQGAPTRTRRITVVGDKGW